MSDGKPLHECTLEELVEALGPSVETEVGPQGSHLESVLGNMAVLSEIKEREAEREAAEIALEKWPDLRDGTDGEVEGWLESMEGDE